MATESFRPIRSRDTEVIEKEGIKIKKCPVCNSTKFEVYNGVAICRKKGCNYQHRIFECEEL